MWKPLFIISSIALIVTGCAKSPYGAYPDNVTCQRIQQQLTTAQAQKTGIDQVSLNTQSQLLNEYRKAGCSPL